MLKILKCKIFPIVIGVPFTNWYHLNQTIKTILNFFFYLQKRSQAQNVYNLPTFHTLKADSEKVPKQLFKIKKYSKWNFLFASYIFFTTVQMWTSYIQYSLTLRQLATKKHSLFPRRHRYWRHPIALLHRCHILAPCTSPEASS